LFKAESWRLIIEINLKLSTLNNSLTGMKIPVSLNYLDKLPLLNFYLKLYFKPLKMKIPIPLE